MSSNIKTFPNFIPNKYMRTLRNDGVLMDNERYFIWNRNDLPEGELGKVLERFASYFKKQLPRLNIDTVTKLRVEGYVEIGTPDLFVVAVDDLHYINDLGAKVELKAGHLLTNTNQTQRLILHSSVPACVFLFYQGNAEIVFEDEDVAPAPRTGGRTTTSRAGGRVTTPRTGGRVTTPRTGGRVTIPQNPPSVSSDALPLISPSRSNVRGRVTTPRTGERVTITRTPPSVSSDALPSISPNRSNTRGRITRPGAEKVVSTPGLRPTRPIRPGSELKSGRTSSPSRSGRPVRPGSELKSLRTSSPSRSVRTSSPSNIIEKTLVVEETPRGEEIVEKTVRIERSPRGEELVETVTRTEMPSHFINRLYQNSIDGSLSPDQIQALIDFDEATRAPGGYGQGRDAEVKIREEDLIRLVELEALPHYHSLPTLLSNRGGEGMVTEGEILEEFFARFPPLRNINMDNVMFAGGAITSAIDRVIRGNSNLDVSASRADVDIFFYGLNVEQATDRLYSFVEDLGKAGGYSDGDTITRTKGSITINSQTGPYQFVLRLYATPSEILHGFDLGSSAVGITCDSNGCKVWTTSLGMFSLKTHTNIAILTRRSTTFELRLKKYYERGYCIMFPYFNMSEVQVGDEVEVGYLQFKVTEIMEPMMMRTDRLRLKFMENEREDYSGPFKFEDGMELGKLTYVLRKLAKWNPEIEAYPNLPYTATIDEGENPIEEVDNVVKIRGLALRYVEDLAEKMYPINLRYTGLMTLIGTFGEDSEVVNEYKRMSREGDENGWGQYMLRLRREQKGDIQNKLNRIQNTGGKILWQTENPGSQLTGSYNPTITNPQAWYGKWLA